MGGKARIAKEISSAILSKIFLTRRQILIEPFCGGGTMTAILASYFDNVYASDIHEDLILMWCALQDGWVPPEYISEEEYRELINAKPSPLRGFVGVGCSWGAKWFGGYARGKYPNGGNRNYTGESKRSLLNAVKNMGNVKFQCCDYKKLIINPNDVVYCDPPYVDTTSYNNEFNSEEFWDIMRKWQHIGANVFVSEYIAPNDWVCIWGKTITRNMKSRLNNPESVTEKLWIYNDSPILEY
jgi:DNA adenine methylase